MHLTEIRWHYPHPLCIRTILVLLRDERNISMAAIFTYYTISGTFQKRSTNGTLPLTAHFKTRLEMSKSQ